MSTYAQGIRDWIIENGMVGAGPPAGYSGSPRKQYGIRAPEMRRYVKDWIKAHPDLGYREWTDMLDALYGGDSLDERIVAGIFFSQCHEFRRRLPFKHFEFWSNHLEGWAVVDSTCQSSFRPKDLFLQWDEWQAFLQMLVLDNNINKRRASIVILVKPLRDSDDTRLLELALKNVLKLAPEKDRLITKAVSWVLRAATKHHRVAIAEFLDENEGILPAIALRETRKKLETQ